MTNYTIEQLREYGPPFAMSMLLRSISLGEPYVTYGDVRRELHYQLKINNIFPTHIGEVAGSMMDQILEIDPEAPLINALITRGNGIPGKGISSYLAKRYKNPKLRNWDRISNEKKLELVERERSLVLQYGKWRSINKELFGETALKQLRKFSEKDNDHRGSGYGGAAESPEHKKLKDWVASNPTRIGLSASFGSGIQEYRLLSGDKIDVMFIANKSLRAVEVKSIKSSEEDLKRGLYQCVKYKEVKIAEIKPYKSDVDALLVTERELPSDIKERARILGIKYIYVSINKD